MVRGAEVLQPSRVEPNLRLVHGLENQMDREKQPQFGAFIQVFVKKKDEFGVPRVSCLSYPLPLGISSDHAEEMIGRILGSNDNTGRESRYRSPSGELQFIAREGAQFDHSMLRRFLDVPGQELGVDQTTRKQELIGGVLKEFNDALNGQRHESAQASVGKSIFALSYRVDEKQKALFGKNVAGKEGPRLSNLAMEGDTEHDELLKKKEKVLIDMEEGVLFSFDKSKTVSLCCAKFFAQKLKRGLDSFTQAVLGKLASLVGTSTALALLEKYVCASCYKSYNECVCAPEEVAADSD